jgi:Tfp pilus assembly protein PilF
MPYYQYAGMADAYIQLGYQSLLAPDDAFPRAAAAARKALEIDSTLAEPHATLAFYHFYYDWDWQAAEREFEVTIAKNPSYATAHEWYGLYLAAMGRFDEAHREEDRAQALDPLSVAITGTNAWIYHYSHRQDEAERLLRQALRIDSTFGLGRLYLGRVLQAKGVLDGAIAVFDAVHIRDTATFEKPHAYAEGISFVVVNGEVAFENGAMTAARPGRVLYGPAKK